MLEGVPVVGVLTRGGRGASHSFLLLHWPVPKGSNARRGLASHSGALPHLQHLPPFSGKPPYARYSVGKLAQESVPLALGQWVVPSTKVILRLSFTARIQPFAPSKH